MFLTTEFVLLLGIGFVAQLVDGALGMAYGVLSNTAMLSIGLAPAQASALSIRPRFLPRALQPLRISIIATWIGGW